MGATGWEAAPSWPVVTALVGDFHPDAATAHFGADAEMAAWFTGSAVEGGVRRQLREAKDGIVRSRVAVQYPRQELACLTDLRRSGGESTRPADQRGRGGLTHAISPASLSLTAEWRAGRFQLAILTGRSYDR
jgi:hypothetical protein